MRATRMRATEMRGAEPLRRAHLEIIYRAAVEAVDPGRLIERHVARRGARLEVDVGARRVRIPVSRLWVAGAGKAAAAMASAVATLAPEARGAVIAPPRPGGAKRFGRIDVLTGAHPVPDQRSYDSTDRVLRRLARRPATDRVLFLMSGGASALLASPASGISRSDKSDLGRMLLRCGADIHLTNAVRKHVSRVKGGGLLRAADPRRVITLALSDVVGDDLATIGSGPTVPDPSTYRDAIEGLEALGALGDLPPSVRARLVAGASGARRAAETVKPGSAEAGRAVAGVIGSNRVALAAAARAARRLGYSVRTRRRPIVGEAADQAVAWVEDLRARFETGKPTCVLGGGETTVRVGEAPGRGGRNQEFAVAAMPGLVRSDWSLLSAGTDGVDGSTTAAGGFADPSSQRRAGGRSVIARVLASHDAHTLLTSLGDTLVTGPTGTNVMDLVVSLGGPVPK